MKIGIIGLGIIGDIWAGHFEKAGVLAGTWNRTAKPDAPQWMDTLEAVTEAADVVQIVVADPPAVASILERILPKLGSGKIVLQSSTIDPTSSAKFKAQVIATGARYLEAPFTGSKPGAEAQQTVFYLGGDPDLIGELAPLFKIISHLQFRIGDNEQAAALKLAMNLNISAQMETLCESLALVRRAGVSDDVFFDVLGQNVSYSGVSKLKEPKLRAGEYSPQFSVKHMAKYMRLASTMGSAKEFPILAAIRQRLADAEAAGFADEDFAAMMKLLGTK